MRYLEKGRDLGFQTTSTIHNRSTQYLGFADDIGIMKRYKAELKSVFLAIQQALLGLQVNKAQN